MAEEFSFEQLLAGVSNAKKAGDMEAAQRLFDRASAVQNARDNPVPKAASGVRGALQNLGAGFHRLGQGVAQLPRALGANVGPTGADVAEHDRYRQQLADSYTGGGALQFIAETAPQFLIPAAAPARLLPAASAATRGIVGMGAGGALGGVTGATTDEDVGSGKLIQGALGGALGTGVGAVVNKGLPAAKQVWRERVTPIKGAREGFVKDAADTGSRMPTAAEMRAVADRTEALEAANAIGVGGKSMLPTAALVQSPALYRTHDIVRNTGGAWARPVTDLEAAGNTARSDFLRAGVAPPGALQSAEAAKNALYRNTLASTPMSPTHASWQMGVGRTLEDAIENNADPLRTPLKKLLAQWEEAVEIAKRTSSWEPVYKFHKNSLNRVVKKLSKDPSTQGDLLEIINRDIRPVVVATLDQLGGSRASQLVGKGQLGPRLMGEMKQAREGQKLIDLLDDQTPLSTGIPNVTTAKMQGAYRRLIDDPNAVPPVVATTERPFHSPLLNPQQGDAVALALRHAQLLQRMHAKDIGVGGSATARRTSTLPAMFERANKPAYGLGMTTGSMAAVAGHPIVAGSIIALNSVMNWGAARGAPEAAKLLADPEHAIIILRELAAKQPSAARTKAMNAVKELAARATTAGITDVVGQ